MTRFKNFACISYVTLQSEPGLNIYIHTLRFLYSHIYAMALNTHTRETLVYICKHL
jgi:hypothetical protein